MTNPIHSRKYVVVPILLFAVAVMAASVLSAQFQKAAFDNLKELRRFDVAWDRPGADSKDSMPLGNGDIGLNVWTEQATGSICFYIGKTDAWDETGRLLKLTKVRIKLDPNPFLAGSPFLQKLNLAEGAIEITAGKGADEVRLRLRVDAGLPLIRLEATVPETLTITAGIEPWRVQVETLKDELVSGLNYYSKIMGFSTVQPDVVPELKGDRIGWYHHNPETPSFARALVLQGLEKFPVRDPLKDRIFGGIMEGRGFVRRDPKTIVSAKGQARELNIHVLTLQPSDPARFLAALEAQMRLTASVSPVRASAAHKAWWNAFWNRSWIYVRSPRSIKTPLGMENEGDVVTRGYILQRFVNACAGRGAFPIKFNGSLFTVEEPDKEGFADYRLWGPGYWWQNTRLPYMAMPAAGDIDLMQPFFNMYSDLLPLGRYRTKLYFGHEGAYFPECINFWGIVFPGTWGDKYLADMPDRIQAGGWHKYEWVGGLEMASMMFDAWLYSQDNAFLHEKVLPFAEAMLTFFDKHYGLDDKGRLKLQPSQALETWWDCTNAMPEVAGLHYLTRQLKTLPRGLMTADQARLVDHLAAILPPIPTREVDGKKMLAPAERFEKKQNVENPELYAVYPFRLFGIGKPDIDLAIRALDARTDRGHFGWRQDDIFMALLGLTDQVKSGLVERASRWNENRRFPAFWGPNYDWTPDQDHGGVLTKTLQVMLLQCEDRQIRILPAWPSDWDVTFKLHAPFNTTLDGTARQGKIERLAVSPKSRIVDIVR
jgi:alpha-L-fucosidase 2